MLRLPPFKALRAFEATARRGSVVAAAEELSVTHAAVSKQLRLLEEYLGIDLFVRSGRQLLLTGDGKDYLREIRFCLNGLSVATENVRNRNKARVVRVNSTSVLAMRWLIPRLAALQTANAGIRIDVVTSSDTPERVGESFDVVLRDNPMHAIGYACVRFLRDRRVPLAAPSYLLQRRVETARNLLDMALIHAKTQPDAWAQWFHAAGLRVDGVPQGHSFDNPLLAIQAATNGLGIVLAPLSLVDEDLRQGTLRPVLDQPVLECEGYFALHRERGPNRGPIANFMRWLLQQGGDSEEQS